MHFLAVVMPSVLHLLNEKITYSVAKEREVNILHQLGYYEQQNSFFSHLNDNRSWMKQIVAHHLGLPSSDVCHIAERQDWLNGSFNVCVPVTIDNWKCKEQPGNRVLLRFPLPYRVGGASQEGNGNEKIQCEAGTYAWLQENCPEVPIPQLYGFALSTGETFTRVANLPFLSRWLQLFRRKIFSWIGRSVPSAYARHSDKTLASMASMATTGYMLIEFIEGRQGAMLSNTWSDGQQDIKRRTNLFRGLSRILLNISRKPLPRIGSFIIDENGYLRLVNRPLSFDIQILENEKIPTHIHRDFTYSTVESYVMDILGAHDSRLHKQPNAVNDIPDCVSQMAALAAMRTLFPMFFRREFRRRPFVFSLPDLHQSNIFVDKNWHVTCLVDLEWACARPIEMVEPPYWLTNKSVDNMLLEEYDPLRKEFMAALVEEERRISKCVTREDSDLPLLSEVMEQAWTTGTFWYTLALSSPTGLFGLFYRHIQPLLAGGKSREFGEVMPFYWEKDVGRFVAGKLADKKQYDTDLRLAFTEAKQL
ncbi:hypothetical protein D8B26_001096 [Coccidioides posadasii str. Silveira]|nr:hypothetical protein CPC735_038960 [Coccidioides posadasii C735 delta SOWgp]EER28632.1 hypothetical protein CPC735_038960 [Coccidioides posadasii C735 delta SOWgp]QVM06383.1 hypothetical protein D8B26_001096 [Coccidioides posadasii str. Silveira]|eukprot:XP_003070777.1 hypothetical protein CPC735_038960 [Coccidioides posadasii C735 delta SOWgp]